MSYSELNISQIYKQPADDIIHSFFIPVLKLSIKYDRSVAFFSSKALYEMTAGISGLVENGGHIRYIISPNNLSQEDIDAIKQGYKTREEIATEKILPVIAEMNNPYQEERLNMLSHLIADGILDIKVAIPNSAGSIGLFHEKCGLMEDLIGNRIGFTGSFNDTNSAINNNYEQIGTYSTLRGDYQAIEIIENEFETLWNDADKYATVIPFPDDIKSAIQKYTKPSVDWQVDKKEFSKRRSSLPEKPEEIKLFNYQEQAIDNWFQQDCIASFNMCTGAGKTYTALYGAVKLIKKQPVCVIICCPYQHLVDQWSEDLESWNFDYLAGYTGSLNHNWKKRLSDRVFDFNHHLKRYICFITTNASFRTKGVQDIIDKIDGDILLIVDEAHNFGASNMRRLMTDRYKYRMGLSATLDRYNDREGTNALHAFFHKECIRYTLADAIQDDKLTRYYYYPVPVSLTESELENYNELSEQIKAETRYTEKEGYTITERGKRLLIRRARLVAGAYNKLAKLKELIEPHKAENHILVYCGSTTVNDSCYKENSADDDEIKQIEKVTDILGNELGMKVNKFTSEENAEQRRDIITSFSEGINTQVMVAIKCLDEGVSIKSIQSAYILASSTNPREYIQRRGRVLRKYSGKRFACIYDFVTLPRPLEDVVPGADIEYDQSLIKRELMRVIDFADLAENPSDSDKLINRIEDKYGFIDLESGEGELS